MMTISEISHITKISTRTLRYYDEIGLLKPSKKSEAGYRLYDESALLKLQQILFFKEFEIPLMKIKNILEDPSLNQNEVLSSQRNMLIKKKKRVERLIEEIDNIIKGDNKMDFEIFTKTELEELAESSYEKMPDGVMQAIINEFGSKEKWKEHYVNRVSKEDIQKGYKKMIEWYSSKEDMFDKMKNPISSEIASSFAKRIDKIFIELSKKTNLSPDSFEVKELIGQFGFVMKNLYQVKKENELMLMIAKDYKDEKVSKETDLKYKEGFSKFLVNAIETFYLSNEKCKDE